MKVLNVGGGASKVLPPNYDGWDQVLLDIDPNCKPDLCMDALELVNVTDDKVGSFDAVFCSHNLEHFYRHQVPIVLKGFINMLSEDGFAEIAVPNIKHLIECVTKGNMDLDDVWYRVNGGQYQLPITFHDVLYGWSVEMSKGNLFYSHKCGFTATSLTSELYSAGFKTVFIQDFGHNLLAKAYKKEGALCQ